MMRRGVLTVDKEGLSNAWFYERSLGDMDKSCGEDGIVRFDYTLRLFRGC